MDGIMAALLAEMMDVSGGIPAGPSSTRSGNRSPRVSPAAERAAVRERLIAHINDKRKALHSFYNEPDMERYHVTSSCNVKSKADFPEPQPLERCTPILISELQLGMTHRGRVLRGRLLVKPVLMTALSTVLEDENGDTVMVSVYNLLPSNLAGVPGLRAGERALPEGRHVAIIEPFYKRMADGTQGVRVDNPREAAGRRHFQAAEYDAASKCYSCALLRMPDVGRAGTELLVTCLKNLSAALLRLDDAPAALQCAAAAAAVRSDDSKAHFRIALAAARMGPALALAARAELYRAKELMISAGSAPSREEWRRMVSEMGPVPMVGTAPSATQAGQGQEDLLRALACTTPEALLLLLGEVPPPPTEASAAAAADGGGGGGGAAAAIAASAAMKESGNVAFKAGNYDSARRQYLTALKTLTEVLPGAVLLANLAACYLRMSDPKRAAAAATAALLLGPRQAKAHHRRAEALLHLGWLVEAEAACDAGLAALPSDADGNREAIAALRKRICTARAVEVPPAAAHHRRGGGSCDTAAVTERELDAMRGQDSCVEMKAMFNRMLGMAECDPRVAANMQALRQKDPLMWRSFQPDHRVPPFHQEFNNAARWPPGCDVAECQRRLWDSYELCVGMSQHLMAMAVWADTNITSTRVGILEPNMAQARMGWFASAPDGAVSFRCDAFLGMGGAGGYNPTIFHSFSNTPPPAVSMPPASPGSPIPNHVAVGFVDLGTLTAAVNRPEWDEQVEAAMRELLQDAGAVGAASTASTASTSDTAGCGVAATSPPAPQRHSVASSGAASRGSHESVTPPLLLRWIGLEASPHSVAKTLVVERMMRRGGPAATDWVLQVWYSSVWSMGALKAFREALTEILTEECVRTELPPEVLSYLHHWQLRDVSLAESRRRWLEDWRQTFCAVGQFREKADRLALVEYMLTGQLPGLVSGGNEDEAGGELVGSVVMFAKPREFGAERALNESFLESLAPGELLAARMQPQSQSWSPVSSSALQGGGPSLTAAAAAPAGPGDRAGGNNEKDDNKKDKKKKKNRQQGLQGKGSGAAGSSSSGNAVGGVGGNDGDIVSAGVALLRRRVRRLACLLATGRVKVQVLLELVDPGDATAAFISGLHPDSISWSNVPDFYAPSEFHAMARACSKPRSSGAAAPTIRPTLHYVTSMNWTMDVKGACHLDMLWPYVRDMGHGDEGDGADELIKRMAGGGGGSSRGRGPYRGPFGSSGGSEGKELARLILKLVDDGATAVRRQLALEAGGERLLFDPPVDNPRNVADFGLVLKYYKNWVDAFLRAGDVRQAPRDPVYGGRDGSPGVPSAWVASAPVYGPLTRTNTTVNVVYSY
ncbi:hypothetical protein VOLCADRAFT_85918 [Volvox carteri f. nagariensis]|uniref:Uncharacterized protein n=1 Tax=Volvox carteri f. nagariensis TaxID=3068 RepID=D8THC4_VOLCA|nr:uncharacterized protein VOLCADRAFT_85918 [Volvox carteri f. nagariensis]EFJ53047.1 hypothetical protein VOLCADRAFT_85918 [Volvox carteri f. nagariensis]|eukprot:XP_002946052.1 hypothetical protein VOLCADRAFT_85918 [Volvox carteri f. nagariensis]